MKKLLALVLALVMVMALGMTALADGEIVSVMYGGGTPETMDPALNSASTGSNLIRLAFSGLMGTRVENGVVTKEPELAESYTISDDGLVYVFTLREGLKWSDGSDFVASDVVKSWNRAADEKLGASYGFLFDVIDGYGTGSLNVVADDAALAGHLSEALRPALPVVGRVVADVLRGYIGGRYTGVMGVDMMLVRTADGWALHPCVELNLRRTMGMVALGLRRVLPPASRFRIVPTRPWQAAEQLLAGGEAMAAIWDAMPAVRDAGSMPAGSASSFP